VSEWRESTWGDEISLEYGKSLRDYNTASGKFRVFGSNGPIGWTTEPLTSGPGVILGRKGAYRGVEFSRDPFFVIDTAYYVVPKNEFDMRWLYYAIKHHKLGEIDDGSPIPSTTRAAVYVKDMQVPHPKEQRAIASVLGSLDDKIELNRRMNETLEALAQSLFKSWFVDATQSALPKGWREVPFTETVEIVGGGTPKTSVAEYWGGDIPWFSVVDSPQGSDLFVIDTEKKITQAGVENSSTQLLSVGTTIITARGTVGKIALVGVPMAMNQSCYGLRGKAGKKGFHTYFVTRALVSQLQQHAHGSVFDTITRDTLAGVQVALPPAAVVEQFEEMVSPLMERIRNNLHESRTLAALRDALLPKLLSGELRVPAAKLKEDYVSC
jgi:type I restriction enzyme S subunit